MAARELFTTSLISDANLELYYRLEGNFTDSGPNGFNGTGSTSPTSVPSGGKFGGAYDWNGTTDDVTATLTGRTPFATSWTMNCWIEPDGLGEGAANDYGRIFDMSGSTNLRFSSESGSTMKMRFSQAFSGVDGGWETNDFVITKNIFQMVTVVYSGSSTSNDPIIYVNGQSVAITEYSTPTLTVETNTGLDLGNNQTSGIRTFDGAIDDFALFSRALTTGEISGLYDFFVSGNPIFFNQGIGIG